MIDAEYLLQHSANLTAAGAFVFLYLGGFLPVPYDVIFVIVGYSTAVLGLPIPGVIAAVILATVGDDTTVFFLARAGHYLGQTIGIGGKAFKVVQRRMRKHAGRTIFVSRLVPGIRLLGTIAAATSGMSYGRFLTYDVPSGVIAGMTYLFLGYFLHSSVDDVIAGVTTVEHFIVIGIVTVIVAVIAYVALRWVAERREAAEDDGQDVPHGTA